MLPDELSVSQLAGDPASDRLELGDLYGPAAGGLPDELSPAWAGDEPPLSAESYALFLADVAREEAGEAAERATFGNRLACRRIAERQVPADVRRMHTDELLEVLAPGPAFEPSPRDELNDLSTACLLELTRRIDRMSRADRIAFHAARVGRGIDMPLMRLPACVGC